MEEIRKKLEETTEKNKTLKERNARLIDGKETNFGKALTDYRNYMDNIKKNQQICEREEVIAEMKTLWHLKQSHEAELSCKLEQKLKFKI